jgi:hypothetical protein
MPKKRKTRKQKISTDQKSVVREIVPSTDSSQSNSTSPKQQESVTPGMTFSLPTHFHPNQTVQKEKKISAGTAAISTADYGYLSIDLMRTALLSVAVVIAELLIRLFFVH